MKEGLHTLALRLCREHGIPVEELHWLDPANADYFAGLVGIKAPLEAKLRSALKEARVRGLLQVVGGVWSLRHPDRGEICAFGMIAGESSNRKTWEIRVLAITGTWPAALPILAACLADLEELCRTSQDKTVEQN